ncbi:MAG TPA: branched-chain-amino-acid transaminase [Burkholderiales bacterium]|nr:branched-chain-amino-acid transaminase [Burkholderiales bacterium]
MDATHITLSPRRSANGAVNIDYYRAQANRLRAAAMRDILTDIAAGLAQWAQRMSTAIRDWRRRRAAYRELSALDVHALHDIGISRSDIEAIASDEFDDDRSRCRAHHAIATPPPAAHPVCWMNGKLVAAGDALVSVFDHGLLYGDGVFEGIRFYHGRPLRLARHDARLRRSAAAIRLTIPYDAGQFDLAIREVIAAYEKANGYLRLVVTRGVGKLGLDPFSCGRPNVFVIADELNMASDMVRREGARVVIAATRRIAPDSLDPRVKSLNYLNHILARIEAIDAGADEAILLNAAGRVAEGSADNLFIVKDGVLLTPPASDGALEGITREAVLELAQELNIPARVQSLASYDLYTADECFLTGTGAELIPVREVDRRPMGTCPGPVYARLHGAFHALVERETAM